MSVLWERKATSCEVGSRTRDLEDFCEVMDGFCCDISMGGVTALIGDIPGSRGKAGENGLLWGTTGTGPERTGSVGKSDSGDVGREESSTGMKGPL